MSAILRRKHMMDVRRAWLALTAVVLGATITVPIASAALPKQRNQSTTQKGTGPFRIQRPARTNLLDTARRIDINQLNMFVTNYGSFAWDISDPGQPAGLIYPTGTNKTAVFAAGLWLGATVNGEVRTVVSEYSQEYGPGAMVGGTFDSPDNPDYITYKVARFTTAADTSHLEREGNEAAFEDNLVHHSWS